MFFAALSMIQGHFQVPLDKDTSTLMVFIAPWGKYKYLIAQMGLMPSSDWFNPFTSALVQGIEGMSQEQEETILRGWNPSTKSEENC